MFFGQHGHAVSANLVGHIAIGGNAVGPHDHGFDLALAHHCSGHIVSDERGLNAVFHQLPCSKP